MTLRLGFIALAFLLAPAIFSSVPASAETPFVPPPEAQTPGGPPEARNCSIPYPERKKPDFDPNGKLSVDLDEATAEISFDVTALPPEATCYAIGRVGAPSWPLIFVWDPVAVPGGELERRLVAESSGEYCFTLLFGSPQGHSGQSDPVCIVVSASVAPTPTATPTPPVFSGPTPRPPVVGNDESTVTPLPPGVGTSAGNGGNALPLWMFSAIAVAGVVMLGWAWRAR